MPLNSTRLDYEIPNDHLHERKQVKQSICYVVKILYLQCITGIHFIKQINI